MRLQIKPYSPDLLPAVALFNQRLEKAGVPSELRLPNDLIARSGAQRSEERYLALHDEFVRGGYIVKYENYWINGKLQRIGFLRLPLSEGIINRSFVPIGARILKSACNSSTPLFALGMGGLHNPFPRMLHALGWSMFLVPFYCRVHSSVRVLTQLPPIREAFACKMALDIAAWSGCGWLAFSVFQSLGRKRERHVEAEQVGEFGVWADEIWLRSRARYCLIGLRDAGTLNELYSNDAHILKLKIVQSGIIGWAIVLDTKMRNHKQFGDLRIGAIVDCLSEPGAEPAVIQGATVFLENRGVDLVLSNQSHFRWRDALRKSGFLRGPSNFAFAASPKLASYISSASLKKSLHLNRGNGDGPIHLK